MSTGFDAGAGVALDGCPSALVERVEAAAERAVSGQPFGRLAVPSAQRGGEQVRGPLRAARPGRGEGVADVALEPVEVQLTRFDGQRVTGVRPGQPVPVRSQRDPQPVDVGPQVDLRRRRWLLPQVAEEPVDRHPPPPPHQQRGQQEFGPAAGERDVAAVEPQGHRPQQTELDRHTREPPTIPGDPNATRPRTW
nr:hypothetical protein [uncultured bacterium]